MKNKNHTRAKILTLIPVFVFAVNAIFLGSLAIEYFSTGSDVTAIALIFTSSLSLILTTVPCLVMSVFGVLFASEPKNEGVVQSRKFLVMGIIEIVVYGVGVWGAIIAAFFLIIASGR